MTASHWRQKQIFSKFFGSFHTSCADRAQLATVWSTGDTCTVCGHPTMSNYFTMYKIVAVLAFAYHSGYHCYYLSDYKLGVHMYCLRPPHYYKLGVHMYCLWPPHYYKLGVHMYCLWPPHYYKLGTRRGEESPWMTASHWRQNQKNFPNFLAPFIYSTPRI